MLKKGLACLLGASMLVSSLAACGSSSGSASSAAQSAAQSAASTAAAGGSKEVDMIISTFNNPYFVSVKNGAETAAKKLGYTLVVQNANNDNTTELNLASTDILKKPACLILDPVDSTAIVSAVKKANDANVPVFCFDRKPNGGNTLTFVGFDELKSGQKAADALGKALNGKGKVVEIQGTMGTQVAQDRSKGFEQEMASKYPDIQIIAKQSASFDRSQALNVMTNVLQAHSDINGAYAANDEMAMGILSALKTRNLQKKVCVVGNDGIKDALDGITSGIMTATNAESPFFLGTSVAEIADKVIKNEKLPQATTLDSTIVDASNIKDYWAYLTKLGDPND